MKHIFKGFIFLSASNLFAQISPDTAKMVKPRLEPINKFGVGFSALSGSNGLNQYMLNRIALGGYISTEEIVHAESKVKDLNRVGLIANAFTYASLQSKPDTAWRKKWRLKPSEVEVLLSNWVGAQFDMGAFQLIFRGNAPFLGQTLDFGRSQMKSFSARTFFLHFENTYLNNQGGKNTNFDFGIGLSQLTSYKNLKFSKGTVYTDSNRNYIDAAYSADFDNTQRNAGKGVGYGLLTNASLRWKSVSGSFYLGINNFGFYYLPEVEYLKKDMEAATRVNQTQLGIKSLNTDNWIDGLKDSINEGLAPDSSTISKLVLAPFRVVLNLYTSKLMIGVDYLNLPGYLPHITISNLKPIKLKNLNLNLRPEIQFGGFDLYDINLKLGYFPKAKQKSLNAFVRIQGIEAFVFPRATHGSGLFFNVNYQLN